MTRLLALVALGIGAGALFAAMALGVTPLLGLVVLLGLCGFAVLLHRPELGLYLTVAAIPLEKFGRFTEGTAVNVVSVAKLVGFATLTAWGIRVLMERRPIKVPGSFWMLSIFWIIGALTLTHTNALDTGLARLMSFLATFAFYLLSVNLIDRPERLRTALLCLLATTLIMGIFSIAQRYLPQYAIELPDDVSYDRAGVVIDASEQDALGTSVARSGGAAGSPHVYACNLLVAIPLYIALLRWAPLPWTRVWLAIGALVALINLFLTQTRAAFLVLVLMGGYLLVRKVVPFNTRTIAIGMLGCVLALPFLPDTFYQRLLDVESYTRAGSATLETRLSFWSSGVEMLRDNWLFGMGLGNFTELPRHNAIATPGFGLMHNIYLQLLNEVGIFGFVALLAFLWMTWRAYQRAQRDLRAAGLIDLSHLAIALSSAFAGALLLGFTIDFLHFAVKDWWFVAALAVACAHIGTQESAKTALAAAPTASEGPR